MFRSFARTDFATFFFFILQPHFKVLSYCWQHSHLFCVIHKAGYVTIFALKIVPKNFNSHFRPDLVAKLYGVADAFLDAENLNLMIGNVSFFNTHRAVFFSHEQAKKKAESEYIEFNKTQKIVSDFDKEVNQLLEGKK